MADKGGVTFAGPASPKKEHHAAPHEEGGDPAKQHPRSLKFAARMDSKRFVDGHHGVHKLKSVAKDLHSSMCVLL
jgi:hypothetical protein